jgi:hypothetical protein
MHLRQLSDDTSHGPDQLVSAELLKNCASSLSLPLSNIMTCSFKAGKLPTGWLIATVTPLYWVLIRSDKLYADIYEYVTSVSCKIMETNIAKKLLTHMEHTNLIPVQ